MKYRVKFKCYWYNTGSADNHYYYQNEDFNTVEEAIVFKDKIQLQTDICKKYEANELTLDEFEKLEEENSFYEVENGFIADDPYIVEFYPEREVIKDVQNS